MKKLLAIGEALIDFIPQQTGVDLKDVANFLPTIGGAPTNVCGAFTKLGGKASIITQVGLDAFGDKIIETLNKHNIDTSLVVRTTEANTCLAFVSLKENGERDFSFYRKPSADMLYSPQNLQPDFFNETFCLHFCSVSLGKFPMKDAHIRAIDLARSSGAFISFDPNLRFPLWEDKMLLKKTICEFIPKSHILKISDEELEFITGETVISRALPKLFTGSVQMVVYTKGADGAEAYTPKVYAKSQGITVHAKDTTGAGDGFIGSFLFQLSKLNLQNLGLLDESVLHNMLDFSNRYCSLSIQKNGAISSYPTMDEVSLNQKYATIKTQSSSNLNLFSR